ncbi:MAG: glycerol-3-phosphate 1-O-acyltransferase PlsY [Polyangiaceae bacterium]|nr:glycerol-3-phosphate 1-O-acyltransferase PlsY [Polyangiaceae bacterium]
MGVEAGLVLAVALAVLAAYLSGSVPFGLLLARRRGVDIRRVGSGNIGATNVARNLGRGLGALVLVLDAAKGALPVAVVRLGELDVRSTPWLLPAVGLGAVVGHCFPVWLRFRGGKGVATALGVMLAADPLAAAAGVGVFVLVVALSRIVSLGSMLGTVAVAVAVTARAAPAPSVVLGWGLVALVVVQHRDNLRRLRRGEESRVGRGRR